MLADIPVVALVQESVARELPDGVAAVPISEPDDQFETAIAWRADNTSAVVTVFCEIARTLFAPEALAVEDVRATRDGLRRV